METVTRITPLRGRLTVWRRAGEVIGFVPTMGNLHTGHLSLVEMTKARADRVVVSVFVNPSQFGPAEDYAGYPRTLDEDKRLLTEAGVDLLFAPEVEEVYPDGQVGEARIEIPGLSDILCGAVRPGHFSGVATVVAKLFNMVQPDIGVFGEKDYQQLLVIRKLVKDLNFPVEVLGAPIGREEDGLACSSRNRYLTADQRKRAPVLNQLLRRATEKLESGNRDYKLIETEALKSMEQAGFNPDYFEVREAADLSLPGPESTHVVVVAAGHLGKARLIDNAMATIPDH